MFRRFSRKKSETSALGREAQPRQQPSEVVGQGRVHDDDTVQRALVEWIAAAGSTPEDAIDLTVHMYDAGYVDSLKGAELLVHIEDTYGLFIPETDLIGQLATLGDLIQHIVSSGSK